MFSSEGNGHSLRWINVDLKRSKQCICAEKFVCNQAVQLPTTNLLLPGQKETYNKDWHTDVPIFKKRAVNILFIFTTGGSHLVLHQCTNNIWTIYEVIRWGHDQSLEGFLNNVKPMGTISTLGIPPPPQPPPVRADPINILMQVYMMNAPDETSIWKTAERISVSKQAL